MNETLQNLELVENYVNEEASENMKKNCQDMRSNRCNQCKYAYSKADNLRKHLKTHSGERPNKCNQCDYASSYASALRAHLKTSQWRKAKQTQDGITVMIMTVMLLQGHIFHGVGDDGSHKKERKLFF